jgi:hypothetical protein
MPAKSVRRGRAFRQDSCPDEKESTSCRFPLRGLIDPTSPPHRGPGYSGARRARHSVGRRCAAARTRQREVSCGLAFGFSFGFGFAFAFAFAFGFGFGLVSVLAVAWLLPLRAGGGWEGVKLLICGAKSTPPQPSPARRGGSALRCARNLTGLGFAPALCSLLFALCSLFFVLCSLLFALDPASLRSARERALLYHPPLCGGEVRSTGPQGNRQDVDSFSTVHGCTVEKPGLTSRTFWAMPRKRRAGWPFLFGYFLFGHTKRK